MQAVHCDRCDYVTSSSHNCSVHYVKAHKRCIKCFKDFETFDDILQHEFLVHGKRVKCKHCEFWDYPPSTVLKHERNSHFFCSLCGANFNSSDDLSHHHKLAHPRHQKSGSEVIIPKVQNRPMRNDLTVFVCDQCFMQFSDIRLLEEHIADRRFQCRNCEDFRACNQAVFLKHVNSGHHALRCKLCEYKGTHARDLTVHCIKAHKYCSACNLTFEEKRAILNHLAEVHRENVKCKYCDYLGFPQSQLSAHVNRHRLCPVCEATFNSSEELAIHLTQHPCSWKKQSTIKPANVVVLDLIKCGFCSYTCVKPRDLLIHSISRHAFCSACKLNFLSASVMMEHMELVHSEGVRCNICSYRIFPYEELDNHQRQVHLTCSGCQLQFADLTEVEEHLREEHMVSEKHKCNACPFVGTKRAVDRHEAQMHQPLELACDRCDFKSHHRAKLDRHKRYNIGKNFECGLCPFQSCTRYGITLHKRTSHGTIKNFICGYCGKTFRMKGIFEKHVQTEHMDDKGHHHQQLSRGFNCKMSKEKKIASHELIVSMENAIVFNAIDVISSD